MDLPVLLDPELYFLYFQVVNLAPVTGGLESLWISVLSFVEAAIERVHIKISPALLFSPAVQIHCTFR